MCKKQTNKSIYIDSIAKKLVRSFNEVDKRMLKLHKITETSHEKTNLIDYLGVRENLSKSLFRNMQTQSKPPDQVKNDKKSTEAPI